MRTPVLASARVLLLAGAAAACASPPTLSPMAASSAAPKGGRVANAQVALELPHDDLLTEDVTYDPSSKTFFVSSIHRRKIIAVDSTGRARDFIASGSAGPGGISGVAVHGARLWATVAALPPAGAATGPTALLAFDVASGALLERTDLAAGEGGHALTDLAVGPTGDVFVSDTTAGVVYRVRRGEHRMEAISEPGALTLLWEVAPVGGLPIRVAALWNRSSTDGESVFVAIPRPARAWIARLGPQPPTVMLKSPQTPAPTHDGKRVLIADFSRGIAAIEIATRAVSWLAHAPEIVAKGVDGLYFGDSDLTLFAIQNGNDPPRVVRFTVDAAHTRIEKVDVLEQGTAGLGEPTHGVLVGESFYFVANAGWDRFGRDGAVRADAPPDAPALWKLRALKRVPSP